MNLRMTLATSVAATILLALSGCNDGGDDTSAGGTPSASGSASPTATESPDTAALVGDWEDTEAQWTVHFNPDGTFVEDFQGIVDFRVGTYQVKDETVSLVGDDGNTTTGTISGDTLVFDLGTLTRS